MRRKSITTEMMESFLVESLLLLLDQKSFEEITVGEIVQKAGVNRSTYYRHFEKKEDIIRCFLNGLSENILEWDKEQKPEFREYLIYMYRHYWEHKQQMLAIYKNGLFGMFLDVLKKNLGAEENADEPTDVQYNMAFHIGGTFNHFLLWLSRGMADTPEEMADYTLAVLPPDLIERMWSTHKGRDRA